MLNSVYTFSGQFIPVFKESISYALSDVQKRTALIAFSAIALLTICYLVVRRYRQSEELDTEIGVSKEDVAATSTKDEEEANEELFRKAMDLMFHDRELEWGKWLAPLTAKQQKERHEELKKAILTLPSKYINSTTIYRDGMMGRIQTLLLQAIMNIQDPDQRLEIVTMLLDKGADPQKEGSLYTAITPKEAAEATKDVKLIALIQAAIDKDMKTDATTDEKAPEAKAPKADVPADKKEPETTIKAAGLSAMVETKVSPLTEEDDYRDSDV